MIETTGIYLYEVYIALLILLFYILWVIEVFKHLRIKKDTRSFLKKQELEEEYLLHIETEKAFRKL